MLQENADSESSTVEVLTYTVDTIDYPCNVPSTEVNIQPTKRKKRKVFNRTVKNQPDNCPPPKMIEYYKSYYRPQLRSLFREINAACKMEKRILTSAGVNATINQQNKENGSPYFSVLERRFQTLANLQ